MFFDCNNGQWSARKSLNQTVGIFRLLKYKSVLPKTNSCLTRTCMNILRHVSFMSVSPVVYSWYTQRYISAISRTETNLHIIAKLKTDWTLWTRKFLKPDRSTFPKFGCQGMSRVEVPASKMVAGFGQRQLNEKMQKQSWRQKHEGKFSSELVSQTSAL